MPPLAVATAPSRPLARRLPPRALASLALAIGALGGGTALAARVLVGVLALDPAWPSRVAWLVGAGGLLVFALAARRLAAASFGVANLVTLARAALTAALLALVGTVPSAGAAWIAVGLGGTVLALDGADGALARRRGEASDFGARFDMETDALLILALAALVWQLGKAGPWILVAGAMRYAFVAAGLVWPRLRGRLPPSQRRQTICVAQIAALMVCLAPFVPPYLSGPLGLLSVTLLAVSFALDVAWLARRSQG
jgi:phosphatidylglycerophosphate synthase